MAVKATAAIIQQSKTALLVCDVQEKFAQHIFNFDKIVTNSAKLISAMKILNIPILVTEQNPKGLGKIVPQLDITGAKGPFPKTKFSMYSDEVSKEISTLCSGEPPESIILIGIEAHVCIENTAIDLRAKGFEVHTVADCCSSRSQEDRILALERMKQIGCHISTSENVIFKILGDAKHPNFKQIQSLVKTTSLPTDLVTLAKM